MNRFRTKKKGRDDDGIPRPSHESESSMPFRGFRKGKKSQEHEKKEVDLATVLPSNDDFRTSLLMTGLSARFSMLREQDDPNTKIGKASDDSVLFPKRQSRMDLALFRGLGDIAEVESIKAATPFGRMESYHSDDADSLNAGSIMSRAKPTEGNNLFGGRQKIYKIPAGASSSRAVDGGMAGRALYDDDVAQSAFQKWRRAEKERESSQEDPDGSDTQEEQRDSSADLDPRSESPASSSYNRRRETSSTLSSIPSVARHSSAATSVTSSQPAASSKDWQPSNGYTSGPERSVTRTRRLYETNFMNQDAQESAAGGLSRIDTLNRQRPFGTRAPDTNQQLPPLGFVDRLSGERRLLAMGSAPNLRSISPPASASPTGTPQLGIRVPSVGENRSNFASPAPLSPPISETDENSLMSINPNDRGKATALGVFQKPAQPYDESRYAQRQLQLQRGRETPTQRTRDEPDPSASRNRSRSPSPSQQDTIDSPTVPVSMAAQLPVIDAPQPTSFLAESDESETSSMISPMPLPSPQIHLRRPSDREHPAFRDSALPTPLALVMKPQHETSIAGASPPEIEPNEISPADSPTLGPVTGSSGLSGMVRQHLRADSNASSIYDSVPPTVGPESRFSANDRNSNSLREYAADSNPWEGDDHSRDWNLDIDVNEPLADAQLFVPDSSKPDEVKTGLPSARKENTDEFASQLADGARRIREKLTSYVETDSRSSSPHRIGEQSNADDLEPLPRPGGLGAILRPKSSRGSLVDRGREPSSSKAFKIMGISPGASRTVSPGSEPQIGQLEIDREPGQHREKKEMTQGSDNQHPGLRQFQQARLELQRLKEHELQSRHPPAPHGPPPEIPSPQHGTAPGNPRTTPSSRDQKPPPIHYQQRMPSEGLPNGDLALDPEVQSRNDRQRSESASGHGTQFNSRGPRAGDELTSRQGPHAGHVGSNPRLPVHSPRLPGTDIRSTPVVPQPYPNSSSRPNQSTFDANGQLHLPRVHGSGQHSPISPGVSPLVNSAPTTPALSPPRPPVAQTPSYDNLVGSISSLQEPMKRKVNPRDISEPTLVMSTSRVPTVALPPEAEGNRSRSSSRAAAPPLPPINPRRRQDGSKVRTVLETFSRQGRDNVERNTITGTPNFPVSGLPYDQGRRSAAATGNGQDAAAHFRRPQRPIGDTPGVNVDFNKPWGANPNPSVGPPASRIVSAQGRKSAVDKGLPGGMI
ncbi:hypothetical protein F5Y14DRAFT_308820 [Nemania sp. NC0429]|nr:hypothetical protein F5Y14DRAFT_308820 [Nemania sp. NC0429]